jgi:hypothetical protein
MVADFVKKESSFSDKKAKYLISLAASRFMDATAQRSVAIRNENLRRFVSKKENSSLIRIPLALGIRPIGQTP